jgi:FHS family Na+ dependent glucose MFS transporter 1
LLFCGMGLAVGLIDVGCNTLLVWLYRSEVAPHMNVLHLSFGVGAVLSPLLIDRVDVVAGDAAKAYWLFAALMVPVAIWMLLTTSPRQPLHRDSPQRGGVVRRHAVFLGIIGLFFFMHVGAQSSIGGWIFNFAEEQGQPETTARLLNSVFWGGLVLGRLLAIPLSKRVRPLTMLTIDLSGAAASLLLIGLFPDSSAALWLGSAGFGASIASVFATSINFAERRIPITSHVTAVFLVGGSSGSMTMPWIIGQYFETSGPATMLWVAGAAVAASAILLGVMSTRAPEQIQ